MDAFYCLTENGQEESILARKNKKKVNANTCQNAAEEKLNKFRDEMDKYILSGTNFFEERENEDIEYNELINNQNNEIYQFNELTNRKIEKIKLDCKKKKEELKNIYEAKNKEFIEKVKGPFDKNYKPYTYSKELIKKQDELNKKMEDCLYYGLSLDNYNNYYCYDESLRKDWCSSYKSWDHKRIYEELSKELEMLQKEDELKYKRKKEKDFEKILKILEDEYKKICESFEEEKNSKIEEYKNQRTLKLKDIKKR